MIDEQQPDTVKLYFKSVNKHCTDYKIIRLDDSNIYEYLDLPNFVWEKKYCQALGHSLQIYCA